jgi:hypothetical protein
MNRKQRRAAKANAGEVGDIVNVGYGYLQERDPNCGLPVNCYACDAQHPASGVGVIQDRTHITHVPLCESCLHTEHGRGQVVRRYWNAPNLKIKISEGGPVTNEQLQAMSEKLRSGATEQ